MNTARELRLSLPYGELAAQAYGTPEGLPVLALHGWLDNAASFARLAPLLEGLNLVVLDLPGHGYSAHRPAGCQYALWDYVQDVLLAAEQLGWQRFALLGHSLGAIISVLLAGALPERISHLALIDGLLPYTHEASAAPAQLGLALKALSALSDKRKPVYEDVQQALAARLKGIGQISPEAAQLLLTRGLEPVAGGMTWRTDTRLTLPSPLRLSKAQAWAFVDALRCPTRLVVAQKGLLTQQPKLLDELAGRPIDWQLLEGGHHLHLDSASGARAVADCINPLFAKA